METQRGAADFAPDCHYSWKPDSGPGGITSRGYVRGEEKTWEKQKLQGYDLPVGKREREEAEAACKKAMNLTGACYRKAEKGDASNGVLSDADLIKMKEILKKSGLTVSGADAYSTMEHWTKMDRFLFKLPGSKSRGDCYVSDKSGRWIKPDEICI
ncbi:MAG: DUF6070 family protein [Sellimonas intestinalis]